MRFKFAQRPLRLFWFCFLAVLFGASAQAAEVSIPDFHVAGDGVSPTTAQYTDVTKGTASMAIKDLASTNEQGTPVVSYPLELPPAILRPALSLSYSAGGWNLEMPYGWSLGGIAEIRRPLTSAYSGTDKASSSVGDVEFYWPAELLVSGPGFSGVLKTSGKEDAWFFMHSPSPTLVSAKYDEDENTWTLYSGGTTWTLEAADDGKTSVEGTERWRATSTVDAVGNRIDYSYHSDGRIKEITYGGNATTGDEKLVTVAFEYQKNTFTHTSLRAGFLTSFAYHITQVTIKTSDSKVLSPVTTLTKPSTKSDASWLSFFKELSPLASASAATPAALVATPWSPAASVSSVMTRIGAYVLNYTVTDSALDLLTSITREGASSAESETLASFTYTAFANSDTASRTSTTMAPKNLGYTKSVTTRDDPEDDGETVSSVTHEIIDINGDGLPDSVDSRDTSATDKEFDAKIQKVDYDARSFSWSDTKEITADDYPQQEIKTISQVGIATTRALIDFDGDGHLDRVTTDDGDFLVQYGDGHTFSSGANSDDISMPTALGGYVQVAHAEDAEPYMVHPSIDLKRGFVDFNGDGFLDIYDGKSVRFHSGARGGKYGDAVTLSYPYYPGDPLTMDCMRSVHYTVAKENSSGVNDAVESFCKGQCEEDCSGDDEGDADSGDASDDEDSADTCTEDCQTDCSSHQRQYYFSNTDEVGALYDLNGDGLPDRVDARTTPWVVYLNNGHDFTAPRNWLAPVAYSRRTDEGRPDIEWDSDEMNIHEDETGSESAVYQMLLDVDGDGLLDLALGNNTAITSAYRDTWFKNNGDGFATTARKLPGWWPDGFMTSKATASVDGDSGSSVSTTTTTSLMLDLDHDGALDAMAPAADTWICDDSEYRAAESKCKEKYASKTGAEADVLILDCAMDVCTEATSVSYGPGAPYLIKTVKNGQGGATEISYRSLSTVTPSGQWMETQHTPNVKTLVDTVTSVDTLTDQTAKTDHAYADGYFEKGVFQGFKTHSVIHKINGAWTDKMVTSFDLDRDYALPTTEKTYTDFNLNFSSNLSRGAANPQLRYQVDTEYGDYQNLSQAAFHLAKSKKVTEYGEGGGAGKSVTHSYTWDSWGNLTKYEHNGGGNTDDEIDVDMSYAFDGDKQFFRMATKMVSGRDPLEGKTRAFEYTRYYYDNASVVDDELTDGLLTKIQSSGGFVHDGKGALDDELLDVTFERDSRGGVTKATDKATGMSISQTFGFGGAVLKTQTNDLGQTITKTIDSQGRVTKVADSNGLGVSTTYDGFNRVTKTAVTGTDGKTYTVKDLTYTHTASPYYMKEQTYDSNGKVENTGYVIQNGSGQDVQTWEENANGKYLVTNSIYDLRGLLFLSTHPEVSTTGFRTTTPLTLDSNKFAFNKYDAFGTPRDVTRDKSLGLKYGAIYLDNPREQKSQDENGYQTKLTYDAHHRITTVEQGKASAATSSPGPTKSATTAIPSFTTTAKYKYYPTGQLAEFKDANGVYYDYSYDGAGRLRQVSYGSGAALNSSGLNLSKSTTTKTTTASKKTTATPATTISLTPTTWYTYEYKGSLRTSMTDATGANTKWEYDAIGRPSKMTMSDGLPTSKGTLIYSYTYDTAWKGALDAVTDPVGKTFYSYDKFGRVSKTSRSYINGTTATTPTILYTTDLHGRETSRTLPSGRKIFSTYAHGYLTEQSSATLGVNDYTLNYAYNKWGLLTTATSSKGHTFMNTFTTPLWVDEIKIAYGSDSTAYAYKWQDDGLLTSRTVTTGSASSSSSSSSSSSTKKAVTSLKVAPTIYSYSYDNLRELTKITTLAKTIESYAYDSAGNPTSMVDTTGLTWTYGAAGSLNQIAKRTSSKGETENYTFDKAGRVATITTSSGTKKFYYDGLGRLRGVDKDGTVTRVIDYDADGNMIRMADGDPLLKTTTPNFIFAFHDWRYDTKTAKYTESDNAFVATQNGDRTWLFKDYDGHAGKTYNDAGMVQSTRTLGAFGAVATSTGTTWDLNSFHGVEEQDDVFLMGQRHLLQKDGTWLQPEPLLYSGLPQDKLADPLGFATRRYSRNNPAQWSDPNGDYAQVEVNGTQVTITIPIQFTGGTLEMRQQLSDSIERQWSGTFGDLHVTTHVVAGGSNNPRNRNAISIMDEKGRSYTTLMSVAGHEHTRVSIYTGTPYYENTIAHEAGHVMGLDDEYHEWTLAGVEFTPGTDPSAYGANPQPTVGVSNFSTSGHFDIMAEPASIGGIPTEKNIWDIVFDEDNDTTFDPNQIPTPYDWSEQDTKNLK